MKKVFGSISLLGLELRSESARTSLHNSITTTMLRHLMFYYYYVAKHSYPLFTPSLL